MILSNISVPLLAMVDSGVLGHLDSPEYLAGVALGGAVFSLLFMGMNFLRMGTTGIAAQQFGAKDGAGLKQSLLQATIVACLLAAAMITLQNPIGALSWYLFEGGPDVEAAAAVYFHIRIWGAPATLVNFALIGWFIGLQNARIPLVIVLVVNLTNIVLDLLFVNMLGMTADGVALASVIAETTGALIGLSFVAREWRRWPQPMRTGALARPAAYTRFFSINANIFVRTIALVGTLAFITAQGARFGEVILAANAILMNMQYLLSYGLDGLAHATEALVGQAWGARDRRALQAAVRVSLGWSLLVAVGFALLFWLAGQSLVALLTDLPAVRAAAADYLPWIVLSALVSVWSFLFDGVFVGTTWAQEMRNVMLAATLFVFVPAWWLSLDWGNHGLWLSFTVFMAARGIGMALTYRQRMASAATDAWLTPTDVRAS